MVFLLQSVHTFLLQSVFLPQPNARHFARHAHVLRSERSRCRGLYFQPIPESDFSKH
jgi:hypothetical protein